MVTFESIAGYLGTCSGNQAKIDALDAIIDSMLIAAATAAESAHLDEYWFDDGHVKIRTKYRNVTELQLGIKNMETLKQMYINRTVGRMVRRMDSSNFNGC